VSGGCHPVARMSTSAATLPVRVPRALPAALAVAAVAAVAADALIRATGWQPPDTHRPRFTQV